MAEIFETKQMTERVILVGVSCHDNDDTEQSLEELCEAAGIIPELAGTMTELGSECGISVKASCACVCR